MFNVAINNKTNADTVVLLQRGKVKVEAFWGDNKIHYVKLRDKKALQNRITQPVMKRISHRVTSQYLYVPNKKTRGYAGQSNYFEFIVT